MRIVEPWTVGQRAAVWMACDIAAPVRPNRPTWLPGKRIQHPDLYAAYLIRLHMPVPLHPVYRH